MAANSETMSSPNEWIHFYQSDFTGTELIAQPPPPPAAPGRNDNLIPDNGRISKPLRRRSRASRRAPVTLLNTDAANFRALVQQFTGGPIPPLANGAQLPHGGATFGFDSVESQQTSGSASAGGFRVMYSNQEPQQSVSVMNEFPERRGVSSHPQLGSSAAFDYTDYGSYLL